MTIVDPHVQSSGQLKWPWSGQGNPIQDRGKDPVIADPGSSYAACSTFHKQS